MEKGEQTGPAFGPGDNDVNDDHIERDNNEPKQIKSTHTQTIDTKLFVLFRVFGFFRAHSIDSRSWNATARKSGWWSQSFERNHWIGIFSEVAHFFGGSVCFFLAGCTAPFTSFPGKSRPIIFPRMHFNQRAWPSDCCWLRRASHERINLLSGWSSRSMYSPAQSACVDILHWNGWDYICICFIRINSWQLHFIFRILHDHAE